MANDDPTSRKMGFGGKQALASGITGFRVRSSSQMNAALAMKPMEKQMRDLVAKNPALEPVILEIGKKLWDTRGQFSHDDILFELEARGLVTIKRP